MDLRGVLGAHIVDCPFSSFSDQGCDSEAMARLVM